MKVRPPADTGTADTGRADTGPPDAGALDAGPPDAGAPDGGAPDAGPEDPTVNGAGPAVRVPGVDVPDRCETDPALTPDGQFLYLAEPTGRSCLGERRYRILRWNDGAPTDTGALLGDANYRRLFPFEGALLGAPGGYGMLVELGGNLAERLLSGDPPRFEGDPRRFRDDAGSPTLTRDGARLIYSHRGRLFEVTDPFGAATPARELAELAGIGLGEVAVSPDGRVIVYAALPSALAQADLYVATRRSRDDDFAGATRLPVADDGINTRSTELGPFLTAEGDLLFTSTRNGNDRELFRVRGFYVP